MGKVLLVEDDFIQLRIREAVLKGAGFEVITAPGAEPALLLFQSQADSDSSFSIIITDHMLPGTTGVEFVRQVRQLDSHITIVVLSGLPDAHLEYHDLNIVFRQKPCPPDEIISLVQHSVDHAA